MKILKYILIAFSLLWIMTGCAAPNAVDDFASVYTNGTVEIDVAANDSSSNSSLDLSTVKIYTGTKYGTTTINNTTGVVTYTPKNDYEGSDSFIYTITDDNGVISNLATVTIKIVKERITTAPIPETKPLNWDMRIIAEDSLGTMKTDGTRLGQLDEQDAVQVHTLKAINPFGGTYLDVVFINPNGVSNGKYKTNLHVYQKNTEDRWSFSVITDASHKDSEMILSWNGIYVLEPHIDRQNRKRYTENISVTNPILKYMKLIDSDTNEEIAATVDGKIQTFTFNMNGLQSRTFEWVLEVDEVKIEEKQQSKVSTFRVKKSSQIKIEDFDLSKPPMIETIK